MQPCLKRRVKMTGFMSLGVFCAFFTSFILSQVAVAETAIDLTSTTVEPKKSFECSYDKEDVVVRARQTKHKGERLNLETLIYKYKRFDKQQSRLMPVDVAVMNQGVAVLLFDPKLQKIVLLEKVQSGIVYHSETPWTLTLMTSRITREDHSDEDAVYRIVEGRAGATINKVIPVQEVFPAPSMSSEKMSVFVVLVDIEGEERELIRKTSSNDNIKSHFFTMDETKALLESRKIKDATTLVGVQWLLLHQDQIERDWRQANVETQLNEQELNETQLSESEPLSTGESGKANV